MSIDVRICECVCVVAVVGVMLLFLVRVWCVYARARLSVFVGCLDCCCMRFRLHVVMCVVACV